MMALLFQLMIVLSAAQTILLERKLLGHQQRRVGPNQVGIQGLLQPFADALKLVLKETVLHVGTNRFLFVGAPVATFIVAQLTWLMVPLGPHLALIDFSMGQLWWLAMGSLEIVAILLTGWSANTKQTLLGSLRSTSQMISQELPQAFSILSVAWLTTSLDPKALSLGLQGLWLPLLPVTIVMIITMLAETNRAPFDLPEAESELVSGFMTEHASITFTFLFLAEQTNMVLMATVVQWMLTGLAWPFALYFQVWIRAVLPRVRFDLLLRLGWSALLPVTIGLVAIIPSLLLTLV